jgi:class 3 adenylate cyclase
LFADLVGSTAFGEQVDPEAARAALAPYFDMLRTTIEDHAGSIAKFTGDGALALFGVPEVAEDDALRAVNAGVELQQRFRSFAESVRERHGVDVGLRVGVNSGELVIADDDADLVGDVLNTAARLEAECTPGSVLVGEDTWRLTRSTVTYDVLGDVRVKGKADPVATFQVVDATRARSDDAEVFVGRELELQTLVGALDNARDLGVARLVSVIGAPGVGKTRLAAELLDTTDAVPFNLRLERRGTCPVRIAARRTIGVRVASDARHGGVTWFESGNRPAAADDARHRGRPRART